MDYITAAFAFSLLLIPVGALLLLLAAVLTPTQYDPMSPDEELVWLQKQGLTKAEAEDIIELGFRSR